jgi:hypothetical protein
MRAVEFCRTFVGIVGTAFWVTTASLRLLPGHSASVGVVGTSPFLTNRMTRKSPGRDR